MLTTKQIMFIGFVFFIGTLCCLIIEGTYFGEAEMGVLNALTGYNVIEVSGAGIWAIPKLGWGFMIHGLPKLIMWDYSFFQGGYAIIRILLMATLSLGVVWGVTMAFIGVAQGILSRFTGT